MNRSAYQLSPASLALVIFLTLSLGSGLGFTIGYFYWAKAAVSRSEVVSQMPSPEPIAASVGSIRIEPAYRLLALEAETLLAQGEYAQAIDRLIEAELVAPNLGATQWVEGRLTEATQVYVTALSSQGRDDVIDNLYQRLISAMPEKAVFYLRLALHRLESGEPESALPVLSQIENHQQYGPRARELMAGIATETAVAPLYSLPLHKKGDQYLVGAVIDGQLEVTLLIDTGASMTMLTPAILAQLGYRLDGEQANFSTANGLVTAPLVQISQIALGEAALEALTVGALTLGGTGPGFDGLLGMNFLRQFEFSLDQEAQQLHLKETRTLKARN